MFDLFWQLDELPVDEVRDALTAVTGPLPDLDRLDTATRLAHGLPGRPLKLRTLSVAKDADVLDLGPVAEEQLRIAGNTWDGASLAPEERLDGELEGSFAGTLERRVLADAEAPGDTPLFDVLLFAEDSGVVFAAGTTKVVALIAYRKVELRDPRTRLALEGAIAADPAPASEPVAPASVVATETERAEETEIAAPDETRRTTRGRPVAKKVAKEAVTKKAVTKTTVAKKAVAKKAVAKTTAKKSVAKKTVAKKTAAKKTVAKKAAKKSATRRPRA